MHANFIPPLRSWLFAPGSKAGVMAKALASPADAVILDLEDAVLVAEKAAARNLVAQVLRTAAHPALFVRINALSSPYAFDDLAACIGPAVAGIMLPKTESAQDIAILDWLLAQHERAAGIAFGTVGIVPLIETAAGVMEAPRIAQASGRVRQMAFGAGDYTLELGMVWSRDEAELIAPRHAIVQASVAAGLLPPIDAVWVEMGDTEGMAMSAVRSRAHGFQGKLCIHPNQIAAVHEAFTPVAQEVARARRIVAAFHEATANGTGVTQIDGKMIDYPIVEAARRTLADAERVA